MKIYDQIVNGENPEVTIWHVYEAYEKVKRWRENHLHRCNMERIIDLMCEAATIRNRYKEQQRIKSRIFNEGSSYYLDGDGAQSLNGEHWQQRH